MVFFLLNKTTNSIHPNNSNELELTDIQYQINQSFENSSKDDSSIKFLSKNSLSNIYRKHLSKYNLIGLGALSLFTIAFLEPTRSFIYKSSNNVLTTSQSEQLNPVSIYNNSFQKGITRNHSDPREIRRKIYFYNSSLMNIGNKDLFYKNIVNTRNFKF